jgi:asparagine synthase (glutamine-hydrolysing)
MSRIAGVFHQAGRPPDSAAALARRMLARHPGGVSVVSGAFGALARSARDDRQGGGIADVDGLLVALDGRILNAAELRAAHPIAAPGDCAVFAALMRKHGFAGALQLLVGDFALAVLDTRAGALWLGRDRCGVKPLYWAAVKDGVAFASQPGALLASGEVASDPEPSFVARFAASHYRTFDNRVEESPYRAIRQVPAACFLEFGNAAPARATPYWRLADTGNFTQSEDALAEEYRARLLRAVERRVRAVARPGFMLSGGLDSSSVLCAAVEVTGQRQHALSTVYADATYDERREIGDVTAGKTESWQAVELGDDIDVLDIIARQVRLHDEPVATATWLSHLLLCERAAGLGFDALFGGLGGDELNAGEYEYFPPFFADLRAQGQAQEMAHEIECWARHHDHPIHRKSAAVAAQMMARLTDPATPGRSLPDRARMLRYQHVLRPEFFDLGRFEPVMDQPFASYLKNRTYQDLFRETLPCCLRAEDRQCTGVGIEHHDPFLDHELIEFMFRVPGAMKIRDGVTKQLLRRAMAGILPEATRTRIKKTGWNAPAHRWFSGRTLERLRDRVRSQAFRERGIYDSDAVMQVIDDHQRIVTTGATAENHMMFLWQLANLETWLDQLAGQGQATPR